LLLFVTFFTTSNYDKLLFTGPGELLGFIMQRGNLKGCTLIFYFFIVEGEGGGGMEFFLWSYTYDLGITPIRSQVGGCLTTKNIL
jgi:hypothetical protein